MSSQLPRRHGPEPDRSGPNWDENGDYIVGKGRPPKAHQWQKGVSGNPRGLKPRQSNPLAELDAILFGKTPMKVNGEERMLDAGAMMSMLFKSMAIKGDRKAAEKLFGIYMSRIAPDEVPERPALDAEELRTIEAMLADAGINLPKVSARSSSQPVEDEDRDEDEDKTS